MKNILFVVVLSMATSLTFAQDKNHNTHNSDSSLWSSSRPDGHAPISVMADHTHHKGEFMISYRYMTMDMRDLRTSTSDASINQAHSDYMVAPTDMVMNMHMLGAMYAPSNKITLMAMANYRENDMNLQMRNGNSFNTNSSGIGDVMISALYSIFNKNRRAMHAQLGVNIPTGSIEEKNVIPVSMGNAVQLPYPMQLGTGSFGAKIGLTYLGQCDLFSWGHQLSGLINLNDNKQDYRFGNRYSFNNWIAARAGNNLSFSIRLQGLLVDEISGASPFLNPNIVTTADTANSGGSFINSGFGANYMIQGGTLKGLRLAGEFTTPLYQDLNGIQLKQNYYVTFGIQYASH